MDPHGKFLIPKRLEWYYPDPEFTQKDRLVQGL